MDPLSMLRQRASKLGKDPEAYLLEHLSRDVDPGERVILRLLDGFGRRACGFLKLGMSGRPLRSFGTPWFKP